jgi:hypothetical protein
MSVAVERRSNNGSVHKEQPRANGARAVATDYKIVVTGDVIAEAKLAMSQVRPSEQHRTVFDTASYMRPYWHAIGAASISEIIRRMLAGLPSVSTKERRPVAISLDSSHIEFRTDERYWSSYVVCEQVPKKPKGDDRLTWRIKQKIGFDRKNPNDKHPLINLNKHDTGAADLIIVNQSVGSEASEYGFMGHEDAWPKSLREPKRSAWLLIEWSRPHVTPPFSAYWDILLERFKGRVVVVVTAEDLRLAGMRISRGISWERTLTDLFERVRELWACDPGQTAGPLCRCAHLVVSFGTSGAAIFTGPKGKLRARLIYDPRHLEDSWQEQFKGTMTGFTRCLTAGIALEMIRAGEGFAGFDGIGARAGVIAARRVLESGFSAIGRYDPTDTELPQDLRFPASVAARVLRSAVAESSIAGLVEKAAADVQAALSRPNASLETGDDLVDLVNAALAHHRKLHFDEDALAEELKRIFKDWAKNDPSRSPARLKTNGAAARAPAANGAVKKSQDSDGEEKRRKRLIKRIMGFIAPDRNAIADVEALAEIVIDETMSRADWSILEQQYPSAPDDENKAAEILKQCREIVEYGDSSELRFPTMRIGKLLVTSRDELEGVTAVRELMESYVGGNVRPPLSIAVFGPPGSGKSFAIKELANNLPGIPGGRYSAIETRTFNLSQFSGPEALAVALQQVRDLGLSGIMPLVFWDEFDTQFCGGMGWLRYFLAPMQDGKYQDGSALYYVGRAIFVFAGGTHATMDEFIRKAKVGGKHDAAYTSEAIAEKLPDFVSRLKGFVDVPPVDYAAGSSGGTERIIIDAPTALRRAKLLRGILEDSDANLDEMIPHPEDSFEPTLRKRLNVDEGVLGAFLRVKGFRFGARSMDAIVRMSALTKKNRYDRSSLPPDDQLNLHVDAKAFLELANAKWPCSAATAAASPSSKSPHPDGAATAGASRSRRGPRTGTGTATARRRG